MAEQPTSKRLAKNTVYMYIRMLLMMLISFYTSRVVLQRLGVDDFGIYNVVGSIVAMFASLRAIFASSTQRFFNYEMGSGSGKLQLVFNMSVLINAIIAIVFVIGVEVVGIWFFHHKINIDPTRYNAAMWVFQLSVLSAVICMFTTPYDAAIIAHERMNVYAYISIFESVLRLGAALALGWIIGDHLLVYGWLILGVTIIIFLCNWGFCRWHFAECRPALLWDKDYFKQMTAFAGWTFFGNSAFALSQNIMNLELNVFGGPIVNAARGIAYQLTGAARQFVRSINLVVTPYSVKTYAEGNPQKMFDMMFLSSKILFYVQFCVIVPCILFTPELLQLWLGQVPEYSVVFVQLTLLHALVRSLHEPIDTAFAAKGDIKFYQLAEGIILFLPVVATYFALKAGMSYSIAFVLIIAFEVIDLAVILWLAKRITGLLLRHYARYVVLPSLVCTIIGICGYVATTMSASSLWIQIVVCLLTMAISGGYLLLIGLTKQEQQQVLSVIRKK